MADSSRTNDYCTTIASEFIGSGSGGEITDLIAGMTLGFDSGPITVGQFKVQVADPIWSLGYDDPISNLIETQPDDTFTDEKAQTSRGGVDLYDQLIEFNEVNGLFTIER